MRFPENIRRSLRGKAPVFGIFECFCVIKILQIDVKFLLDFDTPRPHNFLRAKSIFAIFLMEHSNDREAGTLLQDLL